MELAEPAAWKIAQENLPQYIGVLERYEEGGAVQFSAESGLAPSFMLLADTCAASGPSFDIHLGERDSFLYVDRRNSEATSMLASYVADLVRTGDAYSETLISCDGGEWYALVFDGVDTWAPEQHYIRAN